MLTEQGAVIAVNDEMAWVETQRASVCQVCSANKACGSAVLSKVLGVKRTRVKAINKMQAKVGDQVTLGLNESALVKGAFLLYAVPLIALIVFAVIGDGLGRYFQMGEGDLLAVLFAGLGFFLSVSWLRRYAKSLSCREQYQPVIVSITRI
ncbi:hypothetical protein MNBD_GAMMA16-638 [hydrothermal vent metagenome]|uniref:Sigma factor RpoE regulatory protein RseC n=1 Tax=hydrothermal vent metagenome TaxID=652676 RepID=A0A3B0ZI19_9ZZZZ